MAKDNTVTFGGAAFRIPKKSPYRSYANKRIDVHVLLDGAVEFFYKKKKSPDSIQKRLTHLAYIERTASGRGSAMDPLRGIRTDPLNSHPDILSLLLP